MTVGAWLHELNSRGFFPRPERLRTLLNARSYRGQPHTVITLDTATLVDAYADRVELCAINSGFAQPHSKVRRGSETFMSIEQYPDRERATAKTTGAWDVAELCVRGGVADLADYAVSVERVIGDETLERIA